MANDPKNQLSDFVNRLKKAVVQDPLTPTIMRSLGNYAIDLIVKRTRLGFGVPDGDNGQSDRFSLARLAPATIAGRMRLEKRGQLSDMTMPKRSNLTATGQMLDSMEVVSVTKDNVKVGPTGQRREGVLSNAQVAGFVAAGGRPFLSLSILEENQLVRFYRNKFGDLLKNNRIT